MNNRSHHDDPTESISANTEQLCSESHPGASRTSGQELTSASKRNGNGNGKIPRGKTPSISKLHRLATVRRQQGVSLRSMARQLGEDIQVLRSQESESADLRLSDLYRWQQILDVPVADLLVDPDTSLSRPVLERSRLLRIMKTVKTLLERVQSPPLQRISETLAEQLIELMPELQHVTAWHSVGQRRSLNEYGRTAERCVPDEFFSRQAVD